MPRNESGILLDELMIIIKQIVCQKLEEGRRGGLRLESGIDEFSQKCDLVFLLIIL